MSQDCLICRDTFDSTTRYVTACRGTVATHYYHTECISEWDQRSGNEKCLICFRKFLPQQVLNPNYNLKDRMIAEISERLLSLRGFASDKALLLFATVIVIYACIVSDKDSSSSTRILESLLAGPFTVCVGSTTRMILNKFRPQITDIASRRAGYLATAGAARYAIYPYDLPHNYLAIAGIAIFYFGLLFSQNRKPKAVGNYCILASLIAFVRSPIEFCALLIAGPFIVAFLQIVGGNGDRE
jgi:hypothetical protein